jgi:pyruvate dehydrogenase E2 component (dihydrolipoamide acetyltransferase)
MATEVVMPRLSDTMDTGTVGKWLKNEGDQVSKGEVIAEIETDKANMEMESYASGILAKILVQEGQSVGLGEPIAMIAAKVQELQGDQPQTSAGTGDKPDGQSGDGAAPEQPQATRFDQELPSQGAPAAPQIGKSEPNERVKASPLARRMAQEHDIELANVAGTGPGGRITKEDVQSFLNQAAPSGRIQQPPQAQPAQPRPEPAQEPSQTTPSGPARQPQPVQMSRMQQTIARRMSESKFSSPEFLLTAEYDMTDARALLRSVAGVEGAPKVGPNDLLIKAAAVALTKHPEVNAGWENNTMVRFGRINIGFAVALPDGLVVPVIKDADKLPLGEIANEAKALIEKSRTGKLAPHDYEGGTFTISNLGMFGIDQFTAIINPPEACILSVGSITPKPVVVEGEVKVRDRMRVTLACDHRVVYGAQGAEFLQTLRNLLEHPMLVVL